MGEKVIEQIKQALENANTPYRICEEMGDVIDSNDNTVADFIYHDEDAYLIANAPEWLRYLIGEVERLSKCQSCGGRGYVELSHDPYMTSPCECVVFEQVVEDYPKLKLRNEELEKALEFYANKPCIQKEDIGWNVGFIARKALKEGEEK